jgi:hypothetical protein
MPVAALAIGGVLLWMHLRSAASLLVAMGFAATFLGQLVDLVSTP